MKNIIYSLFILLCFFKPNWATQEEESPLNSSSSLLLLEDEDRENLDRYINRIEEINIYAEKIFFKDQNKYVLKFKPINPSVPGFIDDYSLLLNHSLFPFLKTLSVGLDISYRELPCPPKTGQLNKRVFLPGLC